MMMTPSIAEPLPSSPRFRTHKIVLAALAALALALSALVWFHPTLGFASRDSVIAGADLRGDIVRLLWWLFASFALVSTAIVALVPPRAHAAIRYVSAYVAGVAVLPLTVMIFDVMY
jgi:hypothetical protein